MKSVLVRFQEYANKMSGAEDLAVRFILEHPAESASYSIYKLAEASFTSASTIVRLCKKMGFSGFKEFQKSLIAELSIREESSSVKTQEIEKEDLLENIISKVTYKNIVSLEKTRKLLDEEVLSQCVDVLGQCKNICFFGLGSSLLVAQDAYMKFLRIGKNCFIHEDIHIQLLHAKNMSAQDAAIVISYSGITEEIIRCADIIRDRGATLIAITRFADSPLVSRANYTLYVAATELLHRSGAMSSRISQLNVVDILYTAYLNRHSQETSVHVKDTQINKE